jgi:hypothetical protein
MRTRLQIAREEIHRHFDALPQQVFQASEIQRILSEKRLAWHLASGMSVAEFFRFLENEGKLRKVVMHFPWRKETRYAWGAAPLAAVLMSLRARCHFSHFTAMQMHDLTEQDARTVYVNFEQTPKPSPAGGLSQDGIDRAFRRPQRQATNLAEMGGYRVCLLNGKHTGYLGVEARPVRWGADAQEVPVRLTDVERTLIDITVRPDYSGGPNEVLKAYERAGRRASVNRLAAYLLKLKYVYPYHQAIGFYLERSGGFGAAQVERFRDRFEFEHDFYLAYGLAQTRYERRWRLHVPAWM